MRKFAFLTASVLFLYGCGAGGKPEKLAQKTGLAESSGGLVLTVGGESITSDEIIMAAMEQLRPIAQDNEGDFERFKQQAEPQLKEIITIRVSNILLYQQAKENTSQGIEQLLERAAEAEVRKFIMDFEGDYIKAEQALKQRGMNWASFKEYQKKMILSGFYVASQLPKAGPITYSELLACYNEMKEESFVIPAAIKLQLIDIEPARLEIADPNQDQLEQARKLADELLRQAKAGKDFLELAKEYPKVSFPEYSEPVQPESLKYEILATEAEKLQPGDIAEDRIETPKLDHIFIMKLEERHPKSYQPFEKVQRQVEAKIVSDHRKQDQEAQDQILARFRQQAALELNSEFTEFCLRKIYQMSDE